MTRLRRLGPYLLALVLMAGSFWWSSPVQGQETVTAQVRMVFESINRLLVGLTTVTAPMDIDYTQRFASGTGANQANALWQDDRTLAASASENLDFSGSLTDVFGNSITCTKLKALIVKAASANTNDVDVGGGSTTIAGLFGATNDIVSVRPGGVFIYTSPNANGVTITGGSADVLTVANSGSGTSVLYDIIVLCVE